MAKQTSYRIILAPATDEHMKHLHSKHHGLIVDEIEKQLTYQPMAVTRNRKRLRKPIWGAAWEIRFGPRNRFRVLYDVNEDMREVQILAIGEKPGNRLMIGGKECVV